MNIEQILQLANAGFTQEQIMALAPMIANNETPAVPAAPAAIAAPAAPAVEEPAAPATPAAPAVSAEQQASLADIMQQLGALTQALQASAIHHSAVALKSDTAADVAAAIINPPAKKKGGK